MAKDKNEIHLIIIYRPIALLVSMIIEAFPLHLRGKKALWLGEHQPFKVLRSRVT